MPGTSEFHRHRVKSQVGDEKWFGEREENAHFGFYSDHEEKASPWKVFSRGIT